MRCGGWVSTRPHQLSKVNKMAMATTQTRSSDDRQTVFEARTKDVVDLKRLIRNLEALMEESPVRIDKDGVRFHTADPAMVAVIDLRLKPDLFGRFNPPGQPVDVGINVEELKSHITEAKQGDELTLTLTDEGSDGLALHVSIWRDGITTTFTMDPIDIEEDDVSTQDLTFTGSATVDLAKLVDAVDRMAASTQLTLRDSGLRVESETDDNTAAVRIPDGSDYLHGASVDDEAAQSLYSLDYLATLKKLKQTVDYVTMSMGTDFPLQVETDQDRFSYRFQLAPRIEED